MTILGIDPGTTQSGYAMIDDDWRSIGPSCAGVISNAQMIEDIKTGRMSADAIVVEMISSYGNVVGDTTFQTCVFIGRVVEACYALDLEVHLLKRHQVKTLLMPGERSNDAILRRHLIWEMGWSEDAVRKKAKDSGLKSHAWQALALAVAYSHAIENQRVLPGFHPI